MTSPLLVDRSELVSGIKHYQGYYQALGLEFKRLILLTPLTSLGWMVRVYHDSAFGSLPQLVLGQRSRQLSFDNPLEAVDCGVSILKEARLNSFWPHPFINKRGRLVHQDLSDKEVEYSLEFIVSDDRLQGRLRNKAGHSKEVDVGFEGQGYEHLSEQFTAWREKLGIHFEFINEVIEINPALVRHAVGNPSVKEFFGQ